MAGVDSVTRSLLVAEAERRAWKVEFIGHDEYFCKITDQRGHSELFRGSRPLRNSANGLVIANNKDLTMEYAEYLGFQVPDYVTIDSTGQPTKAVAMLDKHNQVVVKPIDGQQSVGVTIGVREPGQLAEAVALARSHSRSGQVMVQEQLTGKLYRLLVINGRVIAAAWRKAPTVTGDGRHTVQELVEIINQDPRRGTDIDTPLKKIKLADVSEWLGKAGTERVLPEGEDLKVIGIDSVSAGGESVNVTGQVHEGWKRALAALADGIGLFVCGHDIICDDISKPMADNYLPLLEMNSAPGFKLHSHPTGGGEPVDVARILLDELFDIAPDN